MLPSSTSSMEAGCPPLPLCLPASLLTLVLHCLPLTHKFTQCSHLCRCFPRLDSAHFTFDAIDLQPHIMSALLASPPLRLLLANISCVMLHDAHRAIAQRQAQSSRVHHEASKQPWFPRAQRVSMTGMIERSPFALLHSLLVPQPPSPSALRLPLIHTLRLSVIEQIGEPMEHTAVSLQPLALVPQLRTLVIDELEGGMDYSAFRFICSLPLSHLDLHGVHVTPTTVISTGVVREGEAEVTEGLPVTDTWCVLRLPTFDPAVWLTDAMLDTLLQPYLGRENAAGLRYISLETPQPGPVFSRLAAVRTLQSLDVRMQPRMGVPTYSGALPVAPLLSPSISPSSSNARSSLSPSLPNLRHLRIRNSLPARSDVRHFVAPEHRVTPALPYAQLLTAYSRQLRVLILSRHYPWDYRANVLEAVAQCSQLRVFEFNASLGTRVDECDPPSSQVQLPALPHLHTLRLRVPIHPLDVLMIVTACSRTLEDYRQTGPFPLPLGVVRAIGVQCRQLRRLECPIEADDATTPSGSVHHQLLSLPWSLSTTTPLFPRLVSLTVHVERRASTPTLSPTASAVHQQALPLPAVPAIVVFPLTQPPPVAGPSLPQPVVSALFPLSSSSAASAPFTSPGPAPIQMQPERGPWSEAIAHTANPPQLSDRAACDLGAILANAPVRYLDAAGVPLLSVHHFASLTQLRALRCQQSHVQHAEPSHVYVPADGVMPRQLHRYFLTQPAQSQPATRDQMDKMLLTSDLIDDDRPVADWQLEEDARGSSYAPSCQRFVRERRFKGEMDGREAFMEAVRGMAEGRQGSEGVDRTSAGTRRRFVTESAERAARKRTAVDRM